MTLWRLAFIFAVGALNRFKTVSCLALVSVCIVACEPEAKVLDIKDGSGEESTSAETEYVTSAEVQILKNHIEILQNQLAALEQKTQSMNLVNIGGFPALVIEGVNVHIRNGTGSTEVANRLGNLVIGYNEDPGANKPRQGSHNLILGPENAYSSTSAIVAGRNNLSTAAGASVLGGIANHASGTRSVIVGGQENEAEANRSAILSGFSTKTTGVHSGVVAGFGSQSAGENSAVLGGFGNVAEGENGIAGN